MEEPDPAGTPSTDSVEEELYERYLDAALSGDIEEPEAFLARHGSSGPHLRTRLEAMHALFLAGSKPQSAEAAGAAPLAAQSGLPFERLGEFRLLRELGSGGMGHVYLAEQEALERVVALKVIRPEYFGSSVAVERFRREARALARLNHPNVVSVHGYGEEEGTWYTAMEFIAGRSLGEVLAESTHSGVGVAPATAVRWAAQIARALASVHAEGILHRDVKPSNVRITSEGDAVLVDFGLAREIDATGAGLPGATLTGAFVGSPTYASPEQIGGEELDGRSDVYSLGVTLYQAITGSVPFQADTVEGVFRRVLFDDPPPPRRQNPSVSRDLEVVVLKAVAKDRARRYASAEALADDLEALLEFRPIRARPPGRLERLAKWGRRNPGSAAALLTAFVAVSGTLALLFAQYRIGIAERREQAADLVERASGLVQSYDEARASMRDLELEVDELRGLLERDYLSPTQLALLDEKEVDVDEGRLQRESVFYEVIDLLRSAEGFDPDVAGADEVRAELYLHKLEEALDANDRAARLVYEGLLAEHDREGTLRAAAFPFSRYSLKSEPAGAEVYLFRRRELSELVRGGEHRMVPVPVGDDDPAIPPGTWVLRVVRGAGELLPEDLIYRLAGRPIEGTVLVAEDGPGVRRFDRLVSVDGEPVLGDWELDRCRAPEEPEPSEEDEPVALRDFEFERDGAFYHLQAGGLEELGVVVLEPDALAELGDCPAVVYRDGELFETVLPAGLVVRTTAAPRLVSPACRLGTTPLEEVSVEPGHYLVVLRAEGMEELRQDILMGPGFEYVAEASLLPEGSTPAGWVRVTPHSKDAFWMMEREVTCAEYLSFLNDPVTLAEIDASAEEIRFPRDSNRNGHWPRGEDGRFTIREGWPHDWPVIGVSWFDAAAYAEWMTRTAQERGLRHVYSLPNNEQVIAAGGGMRYSYGLHFRPQWSNTCFSRPVAFPEPVMRYPIDESVYGVYDLCGSTMEWLDQWYDENRGLRHSAGGSWGQSPADINCLSCGQGFRPTFVSGETGIRLVLHMGETP